MLRNHPEEFQQLFPVQQAEEEVQIAQQVCVSFFVVNDLIITLSMEYIDKSHTAERLLQVVFFLSGHV